MSAPKPLTSVEACSRLVAAVHRLLSEVFRVGRVRSLAEHHDRASVLADGRAEQHQAAVRVVADQETP